MHVMYYVLRIGFLNKVVIGCMVVHIPYVILVVDVLSLYD
jgi:hypothetical protein